MKKLKSVKSIPLKYIKSILKIDPLSPSGLTWIPRKNNLRWNNIHANKPAGCKHKSTVNQYKSWVVGINYNNKKILTCSRIIFLLHNGFLTEGKQVDHIDNNSLNNNPDNLRELTNRQNSYNRKLPKNNTSGHKGVSWSKKSKKWKVEIIVNGKSHYFGLYEKLEDAIKVAIQARKKLHGTFGRIK